MKTLVWRKHYHSDDSLTCVCGWLEVPVGLPYARCPLHEARKMYRDTVVTE